MAIINNIEQLKETVKVNKDSPFSNWVIFLNDARDHFLVNYIGSDLIEKLESVDPASSEESDQIYIKLLPLARRVLGPYAGMLSGDEMSINTGDNGHTVAKTDKLAPASDAKIAKAANSQLERAWKNLEILLEYLENNIAIYPEWKGSKYYRNYKTKYFPSAEVFQEAGLIDIDYSRLTFEKLRHLIIRIEESEVLELITDKVEDFIFDTTHTADEKKKVALLVKRARSFIGARVGQLHSSQTTRVQRSKYNNLEYKAVIRPLYADDSENDLNYYSAQAIYWKNKITEMLPDLGLDLTENKIDWSNEGKKIFSGIT